MARYPNDECSSCQKSIPNNPSYLGGKCRECYNKQRRGKYKSDEIYRKKTVARQCEKSKVKRAEIAKQKSEDMKNEQEMLYGLFDSDKKICRRCENAVLKCDFRKNSHICRGCDRAYHRGRKRDVAAYRLKRLHTDPVYKLKQTVRNRVLKCLGNYKKKGTIEYLGCSIEMYWKWIKFISGTYSFETHGTIWHIDHVIPLSFFDLTKEKDIYLAFNWRNTTPLDKIKNIQKGNKISTSQIEEHLKKLKEYHFTNKIELPKEYIELFAKHLDENHDLIDCGTGNSLEPITTTQLMET